MGTAKRRVRFGEALLEAGYIRSEALDKALQVQKARDQQGESHKLLGIILLEQGAISSDQLIEVLKTMNGSSGEGRISGRLKTATPVDPEPRQKRPGSSSARHSK